MSAPPETSLVPLPPFVPQSSSAAGPTPSPIPLHQIASKEPHRAVHPSAPTPNSTFPLPKIRLEVRDLAHPGARVFLSSVDPTSVLEFAVQRVLELLYISPKCPTTTAPGTRSITLILRTMEGVA